MMTPSSDEDRGGRGGESFDVEMKLRTLERFYAD